MDSVRFARRDALRCSRNTVWGVADVYSREGNVFSWASIDRRGHSRASRGGYDPRSLLLFQRDKTGSPGQGPNV